MRECAIILVLLSAALFAWVLGSQADEIALRDFSVFAAALAVILTVQLLLLYLLDKLIGVVAPGRKDLILLVATAVLVAFNAYFLAFYTLEQPTGFRIACAVVVGAAFLGLMSMPRARPVLALFAGVMLVMSLIQYGYTRATLAITAMGVPEDTVSLPVNSKRNVYVIGMESLQSPTAYRENYGIQDPEYVKVLRDIGFRVLERAYSAERSTLRTWGTVFEFKRCVRNCPDRESDLGIREVFVTDNSTFRSFRDSNYGIQFLYKNNYFPINSKKVDYFFPPPGFDACDELGTIYFYGLCSPKVVGVINRFVFHTEKIGWKAQIKVLQKRTDFITEAANASRPWFTWTHIKYPGHTSGNYRYPDPSYMEKFKKATREGMSIIAENVKKTVGYIVAKDPNAVIAVLGDHGSYLFRGDEDTVREQVYSSTPLVPLETVLEDQHGVTLAIYPANFCVNRLAERVATRFLIEDIIDCLNGNDSPTDEERQRAGLIRFLGELRTVDSLQAKTLTQRQAD